MYKQTLPFFLCILLSACDLIDYHPYDGRLTISERDINGRNIPLIEAATKDKDTIRFVLMEGDGEAVYLVLYVFQQMEQGSALLHTDGQRRESV